MGIGKYTVNVHGSIIKSDLPADLREADGLCYFGFGANFYFLVIQQFSGEGKMG